MVVNGGSQQWSTAVNAAGPPPNGGGQRRSTVADYRQTTAGPPVNHRSMVVDGQSTGGPDLLGAQNLRQNVLLTFLRKLKSQEQILLQFKFGNIGYSISFTSNIRHKGGKDNFKYIVRYNVLLVPRYQNHQGGRRHTSECSTGTRDELHTFPLFKLIQKLRGDLKCMKKIVPSSRSKATNDIINIGSFVEVLVLNHYVFVRKILGKLSKLHVEVAQNKTNIQEPRKPWQWKFKRC
ncbi:hypothetical protein Tco_1353178 [Tanacetum coccineum]